MADITDRIKLTDTSGNIIDPATSDDLSGATITSSSKDIAATGVALAIGASEKVRSILIQAKTTNVDYIQVGINGSCSATVYMRVLVAGETWEIAVDDVATLFINGTIGEGVNFFKLK